MVDAPKEALLRPNNQGETPLHIAALMGDTRFLQTILMKMKGENVQKMREEIAVEEDVREFELRKLGNRGDGGRRKRM